MKPWSVLLACLATACATMEMPEGEPKAKAELLDGKGQPVGTAILAQGPRVVEMLLRVWTLAPGPHGLHIHSVGRCEPPDFLSSGGHFNPHGKRHGLKNPLGPHAGDLRNLIVGPDGRATSRYVLPYVTLETTGMDSLFRGEGTALVVHIDDDDDLTDPIGNTGARIACGVIRRR